jgi:hypothetical protein
MLWAVSSYPLHGLFNPAVVTFRSKACLIWCGQDSIGDVCFPKGEMGWGSLAKERFTSSPCGHASQQIVWAQGRRSPTFMAVGVAADAGRVWILYAVYMDQCSCAQAMKKGELKRSLHLQRTKPTQQFFRKSLPISSPPYITLFEAPAMNNTEIHDETSGTEVGDECFVNWWENGLRAFRWGENSP